MEGFLIGKWVSVAGLPECYFKERLLEMVKYPDSAMLYVVAVDGAIGDWACYIGWPQYDKLKSEFQNQYTEYFTGVTCDMESTANNGDKMSRQAAIQIFPEYANRMYRE